MPKRHLFSSDPDNQSGRAQLNVWGDHGSRGLWLDIDGGHDGEHAEIFLYPEDAAKLFAALCVERCGQ